MNELEQAYMQGFNAKCAEMGVDPEALMKYAKEHDMPHFREQARAPKAKEIYGALSRPKETADLKKRYGKRWEEVKARIAESKGD